MLLPIFLKNTELGFTKTNTRASLIWQQRPFTIGLLFPCMTAMIKVTIIRS